MRLVELVLILSSFDVSGIFYYFSLRVMTQQNLCNSVVQKLAKKRHHYCIVLILESDQFYWY